MFSQAEAFSSHKLTIYLAHACHRIDLVGQLITMKRNILHAFETGGVIHPPVEAGHDNCVFSESKLTGFAFGGEIIKIYCSEIRDFVDDYEVDDCKHYLLDPTKLTDEQEERYYQLECSGQLEEDPEYQKRQEEIEEFLEL